MGRLGARSARLAVATDRARAPDTTVGETAVDFVLEKAGTVVGKVLLADGAAPPVFQVKLHAEAANDGMGGMFRRIARMGAPEDESFNDPAGNFKIDHADTGKVTVEATSPGHAPARKSGVEVLAGQG